MAVIVIPASDDVSVTIRDFASLKSAVHTAMGRDDVPAYVYDLTTSQLNRALRILEMIKSTTLDAAGEVNLPTDFIEVESAYIVYSTTRIRLLPVGRDALSIGHSGTGVPRFFAIGNNKMHIMPEPDSTTYDLSLNYYAHLAGFVDDTDTNDVLINYPGVYFYCAMMHAAIWAQDAQIANTYADLLNVEIASLGKSDTKRRVGPTISHKFVRTL